jgi:hypothetical protein
LKTLFGTATTADLLSLHRTLNDLQEKQVDVTHSLSSQLTYIKRLGSLTEASADAKANLSLIVKNAVVQSHDNFQEVSKDIKWLNFTFHHQNELFMAIKGLEFALLQLTQIFDELLNSLQYVTLGKLPVSLISPTVLHGILRNVSSQLPENYELIGGTRIENVHLYYELTSVMVMGNPHGIKLLMSVPLKPADSYFTLYKIVALPARVSDNKLIQYLVNFPYFALSHGQRDYILLTEAELRLCTGDTLTVCPANMAIYDVRTKTCESSLFFQTPDSQSKCRKRVLIAYDTPTLQRHGDTWLYSLPTPQLVTLRCWKSGGWTTRTASLYGNGLVANATGSSISAGAFHTFPELQGSGHAKLDAPRFHLHDKLHVDANVQPSAAAE